MYPLAAVRLPKAADGFGLKINDHANGDAYVRTEVLGRACA